jgi:hypothetical protein
MAKSLLPASFPTRELGSGPSQCSFSNRSDRFTFEHFPTLKRSGRSESIVGPTLTRSTRSRGVKRARPDRIPTLATTYKTPTELVYGTPLRQFRSPNVFAKPDLGVSAVSDYIQCIQENIAFARDCHAKAKTKQTTYVNWTS